MVKNIIAWILVIIFGTGFFNSDKWYCNSLVLYDGLYHKLFTICTVTYILNYIIMVGIFKNLTKYSFHTIIIILVILIILKAGFVIMPYGLNLYDAFNVTTGYLGKFLGIFLGILYFQKIKNIKLGLLYLILIWIAIHIVQPFINWEYIFR